MYFKCDVLHLSQTSATQMSSDIHVTFSLHIVRYDARDLKLVQAAVALSLAALTSKDVRTVSTPVSSVFDQTAGKYTLGYAINITGPVADVYAAKAILLAAPLSQVLLSNTDTGNYKSKSQCYFE